MNWLGLHLPTLDVPDFLLLNGTQVDGQSGGWGVVTWSWIDVLMITLPTLFLVGVVRSVHQSIYPGASKATNEVYRIDTTAATNTSAFVSVLQQRHGLISAFYASPTDPYSRDVRKLAFFLSTCVQFDVLFVSLFLIQFGNVHDETARRLLSLLVSLVCFLLLDQPTQSLLKCVSRAKTCACGQRCLGCPVLTLLSGAVLLLTAGTATLGWFSFRMAYLLLTWSQACLLGAASSVVRLFLMSAHKVVEGGSETTGCARCEQAILDTAQCKSFFPLFAEGWIAACSMNHLPIMAKRHRDYVSVTRTNRTKLPYESKEVDVSFADGSQESYVLFTLVKGRKRRKTQNSKPASS